MLVFTIYVYMSMQYVDEGNKAYHLSILISGRLSVLKESKTDGTNVLIAHTLPFQFIDSPQWLSRCGYFTLFYYRNMSTLGSLWNRLIVFIWFQKSTSGFEIWNFLGCIGGFSLSLLATVWGTMYCAEGESLNFYVFWLNQLLLCFSMWISRIVVLDFSFCL